MKRRMLFVWGVLAVLLLASGSALAADNDNHTVSVTVSNINEVAITGGNVTLTIADETLSATDSTTADLDWATNGSDRVITVQTSNASANFNLYVTATGVTGGSATAERQISTTPQNVVTGITQTTGGCDLSYRATADLTDAPGTDTHTVTYTITGS